MAKVDMKEYARLGAEARVAQLHAELNEIYRAFPALRRGRGAGSSTEAPATPQAGRRRGRRTMTAAQRREVSQRMKRYWAARRRGPEGKKKGQD